MEAEATGTGSKSRNLLASGIPNSASISFLMASKLSAPTSSCRPASSAVISRGSTSTREDRNWPTLMSTPPMRMARVRKETAILRMRAGRVRRARAPRPILGMKNSHHSSFTMTDVKKRIVWR